MLDVVKFLDHFRANDPIFGVDGKMIVQAERDGFRVHLEDVVADQQRLMASLDNENTCFYLTASGRVGVKVICDKETDETENAIIYCKNLLSYV